MKIRSLQISLVMALFLAACQSVPAAPVVPAATDAPKVEPTKAEAAAAPVGDGKIVLKVWAHQAPAFNEADKLMIAAFQKENANVEIKYETFPWDVYIQTLQTSMPAGTTADVIHLPGGYTCNYGLGGQLLEVPGDMLSIAQAKETFFDAPLGGQTCEGKLFGLPSEYNLEYGGAYVNQAAFEKASLTYPPDWKTWDDLIATSKKLVVMDGQNMTKAGLHYSNSDQLYTYYLSGILQLGANYFAEDGKHFKFDTPESIKTIALLTKMAKDDKVVDPTTFNGDNNWVGEAFAQGNVGVGVLGSWYAGDAKSAHPDLKFDYVGLPPMFGDQHKFVSVGGWARVVGKGTKHADLAWKLAMFMAANKDNALLFNTTTATVPAMKSVAADAKLLEKAPFLKATLPLLPFGAYQGELTDAGQLEFDIIYPALLKALKGEASPEETAKTIHEEANAMVDAKK
jgi:multiple sugar transport system substrate-binding protein